MEREHIGHQSQNESRMITAALTGRNLESLGETLKHNHGIDVLVLTETSEIEHRAAEIDCVVYGSDLVANSNVEAARKRAPNTAWVALYKTGETATRALSAGFDRCVYLEGDRDATAAHLATAIGIAVDHRKATFTRVALDQLKDLFFVFDVDEGFLQWNRRLPEVTGYDDDELTSLSPIDLVTDEDRDAIVEAIQRTLETGTGREEARLVTAEGERIPYEFTGASLGAEGQRNEKICGIGRDITDRKHRQRALAEQAEKLRTLNHINEVIREVNQALVRASTRKEIEEAVCTHLARKEPYRFAWIGEHGAASGRVTPRAWAGVEEGYLEDRPDPDESTDDHVTAATAIRTRKIQAAQRIAEEAEFEPWREAALERGYQSAIAVPLRYRETTYGVLCVYAPRPDAFDEGEQSMLADLAETIAYAINAAERRRALVTNSVVELEFLTRDQSIGYVDLSAKIGGEVTVEGVSPIEKGDVAAFLMIRGADCEAVLSTVAENPEIEATIVADHGEECVFRVTGPEPSVSGTIADYGGVVQEASADNGEGRFLVELPYDADIRAVVDGIEEYYDRTELIAQREHKRTEPSDTVIREAFDNALTDRQREVLRTAYLSGFFEWPREANSEEVADTLGITKPTFHEHLRICHRKLVETYFEHHPPVDLTDFRT